jgi:hypothetical protein
MNALTLNGRTIKNIELEGVDMDDYPDFSDAFFSYAEYEDGTVLTDEELEQLGDENPDAIHEMATEAANDSVDEDWDMER